MEHERDERDAHDPVLRDSARPDSAQPDPSRDEEEEVSSLTGHRHPYVSEAHEGKPWFEWCVAAGVLIVAILALFGRVVAATSVLAGISFVCATIRLILRHRSPWKIRSIAFDCIIGYGLAIGLPVTLLAVQYIAH